jgi:hypothetical protein
MEPVVIGAATPITLFKRFMIPSMVGGTAASRDQIEPWTLGNETSLVDRQNPVLATGLVCRRRVLGRSLKKMLSRRGTEGSNPSLSSGESVSRPHSLSSVENPGCLRGCARLA